MSQRNSPSVSASPSMTDMDKKAESSAPSKNSKFVSPTTGLPFPDYAVRLRHKSVSTFFDELDNSIIVQPPKMDPQLDAPSQSRMVITAEKPRQAIELLDQFLVRFLPTVEDVSCLMEHGPIMFIAGDALLLWVLEHRSVNMNFGGQSLHAVRAFEKELQFMLETLPYSLANNVVFSDCLANAWAAISPAHMALRETLIKHLELLQGQPIGDPADDDSDDDEESDSDDDEESDSDNEGKPAKAGAHAKPLFPFTVLKVNSLVAFSQVFPANQADSIFILPRVFPASLASQLAPAGAPGIEAYSRLLAAAAIHGQSNVLFYETLEQRRPRVFASAILVARMALSDVTLDLASFDQAVLRFFPPAPVAKPAGLLTDFHRDLALGRDTRRWVVSSLAVASLLRTKLQAGAGAGLELLFARAFVIHTAMISLLPVTVRSVTYSQPEPSLVAFIQDLSAFFAPALAAFEADLDEDEYDASDLRGFEAGLADWLDGRLLHAVLHALLLAPADAKLEAVLGKKLLRTVASLLWTNVLALAGLDAAKHPLLPGVPDGLNTSQLLAALDTSRATVSQADPTLLGSYRSQNTAIVDMLPVIEEDLEAALKVSADGSPASGEAEDDEAAANDDDDDEEDASDEEEEEEEEDSEAEESDDEESNAEAGPVKLSARHRDRMAAFAKRMADSLAGQIPKTRFLLNRQGGERTHTPSTRRVPTFSLVDLQKAWDRWRLRSTVETRNVDTRQKALIVLEVFNQLRLCLQLDSDSARQISRDDRRAILAIVHNGGEVFAHMAEDMSRLLRIAPLTSEPISGLVIQPDLWTIQMRFLGPEMPRPNNVADPRVPFRPDPWQRDLLDLVDRDESALVAAPSSSGKTFISYYCMEKVLAEKDDSGIVIFVSPTNPLANQVLWEVQARFDKQYDDPSRRLVGIGTVQIRRDILTSQIVVLTPQIYEEFLLSTKPAIQDWAKRIRYVIFDEVHSIHSPEGSTWERLLLLTHSPFLALSATISNPESMRSWLDTAHKASGRPVRFIHTKYRFNDLKKSAFIPDLSNPEADPIVPLHTLAMYSLEELRSQAMPDDIYLSPDEALELYLAVSRVLRNNAFSERFLPSAYFAGEHIITRDMALRYQEDLMAVFSKLLRGVTCTERGPQAIFEFSGHAEFLLSRHVLGRIKEAVDVVDAGRGMLALRSPAGSGVLMVAVRAPTTPSDSKGPRPNLRQVLKAAVAAVRDTLSTVVDDVLAVLRHTRDEIDRRVALFHSERSLALSDEQFLQQNVYALVRHLHQADMGPIIVFTFSVERCRALFQLTVEAVMAAEEVDRESPRFKRMFRKAEQEEQAARRARDATERKSTTPRRDREEEDLPHPEDEQKEPTLTVEDVEHMVRERHSFLGHNTDNLRQALASMPRAANQNRILTYGLERGIIIHHRAVSSNYRTRAEMLFRLREARLIFATGTLGLGLNMPAKTVVFAGESLNLDALNFRQLAGRAGRRGLDREGNVLFFGLPMHRMRSLMSRPIPPFLPTSVVDTPSLVALTQLAQSCVDNGDSERYEQVAQGIDRVLRHSMLVHKNPALAPEHAYLFWFQLQMMRQTRMLNTRGLLTPVSAMVMAQPTVGSGPMVLHYLLEHHRPVLERAAATKTDGVSELFVLLAYLFEQRSIDSQMASPAPTSQPDKRANSPNLCLPALSEYITSALDSFNDLSLRTASTFVSSIVVHSESAEEESVDPDACLPVSQLSFPSMSIGPEDAGAMLSHMRTVLSKPRLRNAFNSMSGAGDAFTHPEQILHETNHSRLMDSLSIPYVEYANPVSNYLIAITRRLSLQSFYAHYGLAEFVLHPAVDRFVTYIRIVLDHIVRNKLGVRANSFLSLAQIHSDPIAKELNDIATALEVSSVAIFGPTPFRRGFRKA
ncbi:hypothetical protein H696_01192 [Fonticula alba]|uniref:DEAD/DEAH box helicase n=1 Tax=Fonticula alba TaxID=691883 RepID=A0A058ZBJ7_FONAL|nr:hypothetical protein H696_01192 [Fonticula alba]KCV71774.1 hypothetical protein H696_01192 [Fonticula alba]|eukprot:XP_009493352.1 hypothetical protein H696_01192 [Fonticula alba]